MAQQHQAILKLAMPVQVVSPRVFIGEVNQLNIDSLRQLPGVQAVWPKGELRQPLTNEFQLSPAELVFVNGWFASQIPKTRIADGHGLGHTPNAAARWTADNLINTCG